MTRFFFSVLVAILCATSTAATTSVTVRREIDALLNRLQTSGCEFNRNSTWYTGTQASAHLLRKLGHIEGNTTLKSSEQFIELAASVSSYSGTPYQVRCGGSGPVPSSQWLTKELAAMRAAGQRKP